jgi:hypothetical protein
MLVPSHCYRRQLRREHRPVLARRYELGRLPAARPRPRARRRHSGRDLDRSWLRSQQRNESHGGSLSQLSIYRGPSSFWPMAFQPAGTGGGRDRLAGSLALPFLALPCRLCQRRQLAGAGGIFGRIGKIRKFSPDSHDNKFQADARPRPAAASRRETGASQSRTIAEWKGSGPFFASGRIGRTVSSQRKIDQTPDARSQHKG